MGLFASRPPWRINGLSLDSHGIIKTSPMDLTGKKKNTRPSALPATKSFTLAKYGRDLGESSQDLYAVKNCGKSPKDRVVGPLSKWPLKQWLLGNP